MTIARLTAYCLMIFIVSLIVRVGVISATRVNDNLIDLSIYRGSGQLIISGINPYDHSQDKEKRLQLRTDPIAYNEIISETQERWDFYTSANLPLTLLLFGSIEYLAKTLSLTVDGYASAYLYRIVFAVFDSLLAVMVGLSVLLYWKEKPEWVRQLGVWGAGAFNPIVLLYGTIIPEDKGIQILFMLAALSAARYPDRMSLLSVSAVMTAASIAFKGVGIFILPFIIYLLIKDDVTQSKKIQRLVVFSAVCLGTLILINYPYVTGLTGMISQRLSHNLGSPRPMNGSFWRIFYLFSPDHWSMLRVALVLGFAYALTRILLQRRAAWDEASVAAVFLFTNVLLLAGSLDRMNIGMLMCVAVIGGLSRYRELLFYYLGAGFLLLFFYFIVYAYKMFPGRASSFQELLSRHCFVDVEFADSIFALGFVILYTIGIFRSSRKELVA